MTNATKQCTRCNETKPEEQFPSQGKGRRRATCNNCRNAERRARGDGAQRRAREALTGSRWRRLRERHGISREDYQTLLEAQDGVCAMCKQAPTGARPLAVDHCHDTGVVRALLCTPCNVSVGFYEKYGAAARKYLAAYGRGNPLLSK